jgi:hypothetical protein
LLPTFEIIENTINRGLLATVLGQVKLKSDAKY